MTAITAPLDREAALNQLLRQAPAEPNRHEHSYEDDIDILWEIDERNIHLEIFPGQTNGRWLSYQRAEPMTILTSFQAINLAEPKTWQPLFQALK